MTSSNKPLRIGIDCRMYDTGFTGIGRYVANLVTHLATPLAAPNHHYVLFFNKGQVPEGLAETLGHSLRSPSQRDGSLAFKPRSSSLTLGHHARSALKPAHGLGFQPQSCSYEIVEVDAPYYSWAEQLGYPAELKRRGLDLMHFTHFNAPMMYKGPLVVTIHDLTLSKFPSNKRSHPWYRAAYQLTLRTVVKRAMQVIAVSEHTKQDLVKLLGVPASKIVVIHEAPAAEFSAAIPESKVQQVRERYGVGVGNGVEYLLYTGVWRPHKNLVRLVEAFAQLKKANWPELKLVMAGKEDPTYPDARERIQALGLEREVILPGFIPDEDLPALVKGARVYVFPSLYEGFGLPPLEAMACGTPVCVARSSSLPEVCGEGNAHYFDPLSVDDMALTLAELLHDEALRTTYRERGIKRAAEFSWLRMAKETQAVYDRVLRGAVVAGGAGS